MTVRRFQELDRRDTSMGELVLRSRQTPWSDGDVYEVKLGDEFLMSSLFTIAEEQLAHLARARYGRPGADVVVAGLGLGYTARAALADAAAPAPVASVMVVEALPEVIAWHESGLLPLGAELVADGRCSWRTGDFFALLRDGLLDPSAPGRRYDVMLVDIDHSPRHVLRAEHRWFYTDEGLGAAAGALTPGGVFALWSNDPPDDAFVDQLSRAFGSADAEVVRFHNPVQERESTATVYVADVP